MEQVKSIRGICPTCGKKLEIPGDLEEFSCLYCGARLTPADILPKAPEKAPDAESAYIQLEKDLAGTILGWPEVFRKLNRKDFGPHFSAYQEANRSLFSRLPAALSLDPDAGRRLAETLVGQLGENAKNASRLDDAKYTLCLLFIPAVRSMGLAGGEEFCQAVHKAWMTRYPKSPFQVVTYEEIAAGFERKKLCFITTATCDTLGKPDDCRELTAFRAFRDGYLRAQADGAGLIDTYYAIAPGIVTAINTADDPKTVYPAIWKRYLAPCMDALEQGEPEKCKAIYTDMVCRLSEIYLKTALQ